MSLNGQIRHVGMGNKRKWGVKVEYAGGGRSKRNFHAPRIKQRKRPPSARCDRPSRGFRPLFNVFA